MKRTPIKIILMLLALFFSVMTVKAQSTEEQQKATAEQQKATEMMKQATEMMKQAQEMLKKSQEMMKKIPVYADSIGIYVQTAEGWKQREALKSHQATANLSAFLMESKLQFPGRKAEVRFDSVAIFRVYFGVPAPEEAGKYAMFMPDKSINGFSVVKFTQHKDKRRLRTMKARPFVGVVDGVEETDDLTIDVKEIRKGLYELHIFGKPGEYGIIYTADGMGGYSGIYDFGIDRPKLRPGQYVGYWDR